MKLLPFQVQYARFEKKQTCKQCIGEFEKGKLRLAIMTQVRI